MEIEVGSVRTVSTPTAGVRVPAIPAISADSNWFALLRWTGPHVLRLVADHDHAVEGAEAAAAAREEVAAHDLRQGPADHQLATQALAQRGQLIAVRFQVEEASLGEVVGQPVEVDRLAHDPDRDQVRPGRRQLLLDRGGDVARQPAEGDQSDPPALQQVAGQRRVDAFGEFVRVAEFAAQLVGLFAGVLEVADEAALEVSCGFRSGRRRRTRPDQVPIASARKTAISEAAWYARYSPSTEEASDRPLNPSQIRTFSQNSSKTSFRAGEVMTRIVKQDQEGDAEEGERGQGRAGVVETAHALRVDQALADPQPREEGRGHAAALTVEELDQVEVGADADDQGRALLRRPSASPRPRWSPAAGTIVRGSPASSRRSQPGAPPSG